jgi:hypothetical protein
MGFTSSEVSPLDSVAGPAGFARDGDASTLEA